MRKCSVQLGLVVETETSPGVFENVATEVDAIGEVAQRTEVLNQGSDILPRYATTTSISVFSRGLGMMDNSNLQYVKFLGKRWAVATDVTQYPKLVLYLREEYHGPTPD